MSGQLQSYYDDFRRGYWAVREAEDCPCHGNGWALSDVDTWHTCPIHYKGQSHPEDDREECSVKEELPKVEVVFVGPSEEDEIPF
jgi:hypothetical protein